jgi:SAM-dependent methyltransferase
MKLLDAGSGSGWVSRLVAQTFPEAEIVGVDLNPAYVSYAGEKASELGLTNVRYEQGDLQSLRFADGEFDVVWSQFVLYFLPDPFAALTEFKRITRSGGRVISAMHQLPGWSVPAGTDTQFKMDNFIAAILSGWRCEALPQLYKRAGFADIDLDVQLDRIYSKLVGPIDPAHRRNVEDVLSGPMQRLADKLGGVEAAADLMRNWLSFLSDEDTSYVSTYWIGKGTVPAPQST